MNKILGIVAMLLLFGCAPQLKQQEPTVLKKGDPIILGDQYWTLDFTYFYKGKEVKSVISQYDHRRDCFEAMFKMQKEASKKPYSSGAGLCKKLFVEGQERTHKDQLGYR
jgi:hypothetical protein